MTDLTLYELYYHGKIQHVSIQQFRNNTTLINQCCSKVYTSELGILQNRLNYTIEIVSGSCNDASRIVRWWLHYNCSTLTNILWSVKACLNWNDEISCCPCRGWTVKKPNHWLTKSLYPFNHISLIRQMTQIIINRYFKINPNLD